MINNLGVINDPKDHKDDNIPVDAWINHYTALNTSQVPTNVESNFKTLVEEGKLTPTFNHLDFRISEKEVLTTVSKIKKNKAMGSDLIAAEMVKLAITPIKSCLTKMFNKILTSSKYPTIWAESYICNIFKNGSTNDPGNYRGIAISSILGKIFNTILNTRLYDYLVKNELIDIRQIGFMQESSTLDHIFTLRTIIEKYTKSKKQSLYLCFVDFRKAFDTVWHSGLLYKLQKLGINGLFLNIIQDMYSKSSVRIKTSKGLTDTFSSNKGVRQGDALSPMLFNIYVNDIPKMLLTQPTCAPSLGDTKVPCLLYADDMILMSKTAEGLQTQLDMLDNFCNEWFLEINPTKTQTMCIKPICSTTVDSNQTFKLGASTLSLADSYVYLGVKIDERGTFSTQTEYMNSKALKAVYKLFKSISKVDLDVCTLFHLFDNLIKPILLYAREVTFSATTLKKTEDILCKQDIERVHKLFIRSVLGVNSKSTLDAIYGETGRFPLYIETLVGMLKYHVRLSKSTHSLAYQAKLVSENLHQEGTNSWISPLSFALSDLGLDFNITSPHIFRNALQAKFIHAWEKRVLTSKKLRTFITFKSHFRLEPYLKHIKNRSKRAQVCRLRVSAHNLEIETGRHKNIDASLRFCKFCPNSIEDEKHFLISCKRYTTYRDEFFSDISKKVPNFIMLSDDEKLIWIFVMEDHNLITKMATYIQHCFEARCQRPPI